MNTKLGLPLLAVALAWLSMSALAPFVSAQGPSQLLYSIPPPPIGLQVDANLGYSVATDGVYTVAGAPLDDTGAWNTGVAKVFDTATGVLLWTLPSPDPVANELFGGAVAISGTRMVVGAPGYSNTEPPGRAYIFDLASPTPTIPVAVLNNPSPAPGDHFGAAVAISGTRVAVNAVNVKSVYVYELSGATPSVPTLTLSDPGSASFGGAIAMSGTRLVVSASTSAYVYDLSGGTPTVPVATLVLPGAGPTSVALSGTRVVVGAMNDGTGATRAGSTYVFDVGSVTPTVPVATLHHPSPTVNGNFGQAVAISDTRVIVAASWDDTGPDYAGIVYVFDLASAAPTVPVTTLRKPKPARMDFFGIALAISGTRVVVGTENDSVVASLAGGAYVFDLGGATPSVPMAILSDPGPAPDVRFGSATAISGTRMVVGSSGHPAFIFDLASPTPTIPVLKLPYAAFSAAISGTQVVLGNRLSDVGAALDSGVALVFDLSGATPTTPVLALYMPSPKSDSYFGFAVATSGARVVVGAHGAKKAYIYNPSAATPTVPVITLSSPEAFSLFGVSVAISGSRVAVGDSGKDTGAGCVYIYDLAGSTPTVPVLTLNNPRPAAHDQFGYSISFSGTQLAVGAFNHGTNLGTVGSVYVYDLAGETPTVPSTTLDNPSAQNDRFGYSVAFSGGNVLVGSFGGKAFVYALNSVTPTVPVATLENPRAVASDSFGYAVALDGLTAVVGAPLADSPQLDRGEAYVFTLTANPHDLNNDALLDSWEIARFGNTAVHDPYGDDDYDGLSNLFEEAFDTDPLAPDAVALPTAVNEGGYLTMTVAKRAGVIYQIQSAATPDPAAFSAATTTLQIDDDVTLKVSDKFLIGSTPGRFMRVVVKAAP